VERVEARFLTAFLLAIAGTTPSEEADAEMPICIVPDEWRAEP
jgi:hypothetical protein